MTLLPVAKLGYLAIRTLSKPVANYLKKAAVDNPFFRKGCISMAQFYHKLEVQMSLRLLGHSPKQIKPLDPEKAVALATDVLGEVVIFGVAGGVLVVEVASSRAKESAKEQDLNDKFTRLHSDLAQAKQEIQQLQSDNLQLMKHSKICPLLIAEREQEQQQRTALRKLQEEEDRMGHPTMWEKMTNWWMSETRPKMEEGQELAILAASTATNNNNNGNVVGNNSDNSKKSHEANVKGAASALASVHSHSHSSSGQCESS